MLGNIQKWAEGNAFKISFILLFFLLLVGLTLLATLFGKISTIEDTGLRASFYILIGIAVLSITHFVTYTNGIRNGELKKKDEVGRLKKILSEHQETVVLLRKVQHRIEVSEKEIVRKKQAYEQLQGEIKKIKSNEDREALEAKWNEIKESYEMAVDKIQDATTPLTQDTFQKVTTLFDQTQKLLKAGAEQVKKQTDLFRHKKDETGTNGI